MKKASIFRTLISLLLALCFATGLCGFAAAESEQEPWEEELANMYQRIADNQIKYAPKVTTLANGVQIQRTPNDAKSYNNAVLKADSRGCAACHQDLAETLHNCSVFSNANFDYHFDFRNGMGIETTVRQCYVCHVNSTYPRLSEIMHGIHSTATFNAMGGNCWSCHNSNPATGEIELWDLVKYQKLKGITEVADVQGEFSIDQDKVSESFWQLNWMYGDADTERVARAFSGMVPNPEEDGIYEEWAITVGGEVADPKEYTLAELIETAPSVTKKSAISCVINPAGGPFIANVEITGIPLTWFLEQAGVNEGCEVFYVGNYGELISDLEKHPAYLVYQVNGEPVPYANGYPCVFWFEGSTAADCRKAAHSITVSSVKYEDSNPTWIRKAPYGPFVEHGYDNVPLVAITHFTDGQIISADAPYTFEGYAFGFRDRVEAVEENNNPLFNENQDPCSIAAVEFSMDQGKTWTRCETPEATSDRWLYWYFNWTPEAEGSYVISVRSVRNDGMVSHPIEKLFNVQ